MSRSSLPAPALETVGGASNASIVGDKSMQTAACCRGTHMHPFCVRTAVSHAVAGPPPNPCVPPLAFIVSAHGTPHGERQSSSEKHWWSHCKPKSENAVMVWCTSRLSTETWNTRVRNDDESSIWAKKLFQVPFSTVYSSTYVVPLVSERSNPPLGKLASFPCFSRCSPSSDPTVARVFSFFRQILNLSAPLKKT